MRKKGILILCVVLAVILLAPVPLRLKDGGTVVYRAMLYAVHDVHRLDHTSEVGYQDGLIVELFGWEVYNDLR